MLKLKKLLSVLLLSTVALAACGGGGSTDSSNNGGPSKFAQTVNKTEITEEDKIENKTAIAKEFVQTYLTLLTDKSLLEGDALDTYIDTHFDVEDKGALKTKAEEFLAQDYDTSSTIIKVEQTEKDVLKLTAKLTFKSTENTSTNVNIFGRVSDDGNKIIEIKGH